MEAAFETCHSMAPAPPVGLPDGKRQDYLRRFQLLNFREVTRLSDVMETVVPIHGSGNFPTLNIRPSVFVELVRQRLLAIGIRVRDIRLNGSAATHVLSDDMEPTYKDLDLIFTIDFPPSDFEAAEQADATPTSSYCSKSAGSGEDHVRKRKQRPSSLPTSPRHRTAKGQPNEELQALDDSGYTSSESSVSSAPESPSSSSSFMQSIRERSLRIRTGSIESASSTTSSRRDVTPVIRHQQHILEQQHRDRCWQMIKDEVMGILLRFMPEGVNLTRMNSVVLGGAYVQKMVKVTNDMDKWSLISLNNNTGRNLELKFVQSMKRQFEFSVDSFQVLLDSYLAFREATRHQDDDSSALEMTELFHPTVKAESVFGDIVAAIRHLFHRRICTHRPEEIRGGGLLRYCNLLVREYTPGDCDDSGNDVFPSDDPASAHPSYVARLEQRMCARFFIDFSDIDCQRRKLNSYLESHFNGEIDLKFEYLLQLHKVVSLRTLCLMPHEMNLILDFIMDLVRQTLAQNVAKHDVTFEPTYQNTYHCPAQYYYEPSQPCHYTPSIVYPFAPVQHHQISERSSPMSTYSSLAPSTHGETSSSSPSPAPTSRPLTPNNHNHAVISYYHEPRETYTGQPYPQYGQAAQGRFYYCGCCCCRGHAMESASVPQSNPQPYSPLLESYRQCPTPTTPPIYYTPNTMTCFYQPAPYTKPPQA